MACDFRKLYECAKIIVVAQLFTTIITVTTTKSKLRMAAQLDDTSNELGAMVLQDDEINTDNVLTLNNSVKLTDIKTNYESIFSWNIFEQVGKQRSLLEKLVAKRRDKCNYVTPEEEHKFDFHK